MLFRSLIMVATDRISAFDFILPRQIPYKGQVLNTIAGRFLEMSRNILPNWTISVPDPNVTIGYKCEAIKIEMVIRGYLSGHAWRVYRDGGREICGCPMPEGMKENDAFPEPIITPAVKASDGHDEDISPADIISGGFLSRQRYEEVAGLTRKLYRLGSEYAAGRGLILVDTKYEFGYLNGAICLMDEIHTPDSSRYFYRDSYAELQAKEMKQRQLSKEFVREWLMENNFSGLEGQVMPEMDDDIVERVSARYLELFRKLTGTDISRTEGGDVIERIRKNAVEALNALR